MTKYVPIDTFTLPSDGSNTVYLRQAVVSECEAFSSFADDVQEPVISDMLTTLQHNDAKYTDPRNWTIQDRLFAAVWYYAATSAETEIHIPYNCPHCGENHDELIHYSALLENYKDIEGRAERTISDIGGYDWVVKPLNGWDAEELEGLRVSRDLHEKGTAEYNKANSVLVRHKLVCMVYPSDLKGSRDNRIEKTQRIIMDMLANDYLKLSKAVNSAQNEMDHGLDVSEIDGNLFFHTPPLACEKEVGKSTRVRFQVFINELLLRYFA